jgi:demethylmenaquinone methyltransferase/2-methoxy-6-polyprenyl-1,4-benzoquinol methylase
MFAGIAGRYDLLNHLLSFNIDRYWRSRTVRRCRPILQRPGARVLDLCCGTGDLAAALEGGGEARVAAADFCHPMLVAAQRKFSRRGLRSAVIEADALQLPIADSALDLVTVAFGFRNFVNYRQGLHEMLRVLKPGGMAAILEFSQPGNRSFGALYHFYSNRILPWIGGLVSGSRTAYTYLPDSVRKFPGPDELAEEMKLTGFTRVGFERMTGGVVALHCGYK